MFEMLLKSAFESGGDVFVFMHGFSSPLRGRVQDLNDEFFTFFQTGKQGNVLWAFRISDMISCGLLVGPPLDEQALRSPAAPTAMLEGLPFNDSELS
ncbi:hypothetical protein [Vampirovibrio sp.]|uniref:hypothetical protein n=1 Tax=Vampirovibrio sp. TaxID=2717857 RepID=UPI003594838E